LKHHSLDPYGGHRMVQQQLIRCLGWKGHQFCLGLAPYLCQTTFLNCSPKDGMG
jgi:hypothetical protein